MNIKSKERNDFRPQSTKSAYSSLRTILPTAVGLCSEWAFLGYCDTIKKLKYTSARYFSSKDHNDG